MAWKQGLEIVREIATIAGLIVIPLLIARESGNIQSRIAEQNIRIAEQSLNKEYVQLALDILREPKPEKESDGEKLWKWSLDLINKFAPIKLSPEAATQGLTPYPGGRLWLGSAYAARMPYVSPSNTCADYYMITNDKEGLEKCLDRIRAQQQYQKE